MKKKLILFNCILVITAIALTFLLGILVTRSNAFDYAEEKIKQVTEIYANTYTDDPSFVKKVQDVRVTVVAKNGEVLADSDVASDVGVENHFNREEIVAAREGKEKIVTRKSATTGADMMYYAKKVILSENNADDYVFVRVAIPVNSVNSYVLKTIPLSLAIAFFALFSASSFCAAKSAESARNIIFRALIRRSGKDFFRIVVFHQFAKIEERRFIRDTRSLLHIVRYDHDRDFLFEFADQFFDFPRGNGIERGRRFVHQQNRGFGGKRAGNAEALLLSARKPQSALFQSVLHFVPDTRPFQRRLHDFVERGFFPHAERTRSERNVIVNRHRKRIRFLKHHTHFFTQKIHVGVFRENILFPDFEFALDSASFHKIVHPVQNF